MWQLYDSYLFYLVESQSVKSRFAKVYQLSASLLAILLN